MTFHSQSASHAPDTSHFTAAYPVNILVQPVRDDRNRLTAAFRPILAIPHLLLVGGPAAFGLTWWFRGEGSADRGMAAGALGAVAAVAAIIAWFSIVFTGRAPRGLFDLAAFYLRWRVRAVAYLVLLRDEYPPFGDENYPAALAMSPPPTERNRLTVAFRVFLAIPHLLVLWVLGFAWAVTTIIAWFAIIITARYPAALYDFAVGMLRWNTRLDAYLLLLQDEYPPFSLE